MKDYDPLEGERGGFLQPALVVVAAIIAIALLGGLIWYVAKGRVAAEDRQVAINADLCSIEGPPPETLFVLADQSDPIPAVEMDNLYDEVMANAHALPASARVVVLVVPGNANQPPREIFNRCTPVDLTPRSEAVRLGDQILGARPDMRPEVWEDQFGRHLSDALNSLEQQPSGPTALITAFVHLGRMRQFREAEMKRVLVFSDMLENSEFIRLRADYPRVEDLETHFGQPNVRSNLAGAPIKIAYVPRLQYAGLQTAAHQQWWRTYFAAARAGEVTFDPEISQ